MRKFIVVCAILSFAFSNNAISQLVIQCNLPGCGDVLPNGTTHSYLASNASFSGCSGSGGFTTCRFKWEVTNGVIINNSQTTYEADGASAIGVNWSNVNGNGKVKVTVSNSASCSSCSGGSTEITLPIRYLGNPGNIKINGVPYTGSHTLPCGTTSFTASVDPATNATNYTWELPSGWGQSGSGTSITVTPTPSGGGVLKVKASRSDVSSLEKSSQLNIIRSTPTFSVTGDGFICDGQTKTFTLSGSQPGDQISWSTNLSGSSSSTNLQASKGSANGQSYVTANVTTANGCGTFGPSLNVWAGVPSIQTMSANGNIVYPNSTYDLCPSSAYNLGIISQGSASSTSWSVVDNTSGASIISSYPNSAQISSGSNQGSFSIQIAMSNVCGSASPIPSYDFSVTPCGYRAYTVSPNPAKNEFAVDFENVEGKNFPEQFDLIPETAYGNGKAIRSFDMRGESAINQAKSNRKLTFDVSNLPRGRYILRITKEKEDKIETHRLVLQ